MSKIELLAKIELLNKYEAMMEEIKAEADTIRNSIKAEMEARRSFRLRLQLLRRLLHLPDKRRMDHREAE